jgi:hypothetical protein
VRVLAAGVLLEDVLQAMAQAWAEQLEDVVAVQAAGVGVEVQADGFAEVGQGKGRGMQLVFDPVFAMTSPVQ